MSATVRYCRRWDVIKLFTDSTRFSINRRKGTYTTPTLQKPTNTLRRKRGDSLYIVYGGYDNESFATNTTNNGRSNARVHSFMDVETFVYVFRGVLNGSYRPRVHFDTTRLQIPGAAMNIPEISSSGIYY